MDIQIHIDALKYRLQQGSASRDRRYADSYLKHMLVAARKTLLKRRLDKKEELSSDFYKTICVDFENSPYHTCNCATDTCMYKTSIKKTPNILSSKKELKASLLNLNGYKINDIDLETTVYRDKYALIKEESTTWHLHNKRIVLLNGSKIVKLLLRYIPLDFEDNNFTMESTCNVDTNVCHPVNNDSTIFYDDDGTLYDMAYQLIIGKNQDILNNGVDDTIQGIVRQQ